MLVKIGNTDISKNILTDSYAVNAEDECNEWTDSNKVLHRDVVRQRIMGSFTVKFLTEEAYAAFIKLLLDSRTLDHKIPVEIYVVNENRMQNTEIYYRMAPGVTKSLIKGKVFKSFTIEVTEA